VRVIASQIAHSGPCAQANCSTSTADELLLDALLVHTDDGLVVLLQGITLKKNEEGRCIVARIMHGGMIHRQGE
jgi:hypothetical protein